MNEIQSQFPILKREINGNSLIYLDNAATTQKPQAVIDAITEYYTHHNANIHRGLHTLSVEATNMWIDAHKTVADFINADSFEEVFFVRNTTEGFNFIMNTYGRQNLKKGDVVIISEQEHHSNIVPWQMLMAEKGVRVEWIPVNQNGMLDLEYLEFQIRKSPDQVKIVSVSHVSNVIGIENNIKEVIKLAHSVGAIAVIDAAQSIQHIEIDVKDLDCDFLIFSGHKLYGPTGSGVVYGKKEILENLEPWQGGGEMIRTVTKSSSEWNDLPWKFEAGTPNIVGGVGLAAAIKWFKSVNGYLKMKTLDQELIKATVDGLNSLGVTILGGNNTEDRMGLVSFLVDGIHPHDIASMLDEKGIAIRAGFHCAQPLHAKLNVPASSRVSFAIYNDLKDIEQFLTSLDQIITTFK